MVTTSRRAAGFYRQAQRAVDARRATAALRLAVNADPAFGLAIADLDAIAGTVCEAPSRQQMSWERHHIEVVRAAATGNANEQLTSSANTSPASAATLSPSASPSSSNRPAATTTTPRTSSTDSPAATQPRGRPPHDAPSAPLPTRDYFH